jgi:hexosaminidase
LLPYFGSGPFTTNAAGTGHYSVSDYRDILRQASRLHIDVIPEIDLPGHAHAAIQSLRMRYSTSSSDKFADFRLSDPEDESVYEAVGGQKDTVVNPCMESTFKFIEHVLSALRDMHQVTETIKSWRITDEREPTAV